MQFYKHVGEATLELQVGEATNSTKQVGEATLELLLSVREATLNLSKRIFTNAILQTGRGSNS